MSQHLGDTSLSPVILTFIIGTIIYETPIFLKATIIILLNTNDMYRATCLFISGLIMFVMVPIFFNGAHYVAASPLYEEDYVDWRSTILGNWRGILLASVGLILMVAALTNALMAIKHWFDARRQHDKVKRQ